MGNNKGFNKVPPGNQPRSGQPAEKLPDVDAGGQRPQGGGREVQRGIPEGHEPGRGHSLQGDRQDAKGGHDGANQGGAPRGTSRLEPSHQHNQQKKDRAGKGKGGTGLSGDRG